MNSDTFMRQQLDGFLTRHGLSVEDLPAQIDKGLGDPDLIVVSGSVLQGFGNPSSDVDLYAVVGHDSVTDLPMNTYVKDVHFDIGFLKASWLRSALKELEAGAPAMLHLDSPQDWKAERRRLHRLNRLALGLAVAGADEWRSWQRSLRVVLPSWTVAWWKTEAMRHHVAARLLEAANPRLSAQRHCDAFIAALNCLCAEDGELYMVTKWVGSKLHRLGRKDLVDMLHRALDVPRDREGAARYAALLGTWFDQLTAVWRPTVLRVTLRPADGVETWRCNGKLLVHRHLFKGVEFADTAAYDLPWTGAIADVSDVHLTMIKEGLVWLSVLGTER